MPVTLTPNPSQNPLAPGTLNGNKFTIDRWLKSPTVFTRAMADMVVGDEDYFLDKVFSNISNVQGGAVLYDVVEANSLYSDREIEEIAPGDEFPILSSKRGEPKTAKVRKFGGQIYIPDEARDRNQSWVWDRETTKLGNTLKRQLNTVGIAVLDAALADTDPVTGGNRSSGGTSWADAAALVETARSPVLLPHADFGAIKRTAYTEKQNVKFNTVILNPQEDYNLDLIYSMVPGGADAVLARYGISQKFVTDQQEAGKAKFVAAGQVGGFGMEKPIFTEIWRTPGTQRTDMTVTGLPVFFADNRWAVREVTGLAA